MSRSYELTYLSFITNVPMCIFLAQLRCDHNKLCHLFNIFQPSVDRPVT